MAFQRSWIAIAILILSCCASNGLAGDGQIQVIDFTAKGCGPCQSMQPAIVKLAKEGWHIRQVDVEQERQLLEPFQIKSVPTMVILRDGKEVDRIVGALGYEKLKARFQKATGKPTSDSLKDDFLAMVAPGSAGGNAPGNMGRGTIDAARQAEPSNVRGQSPAAFPMLGAASTALASASLATTSQGSLAFDTATAQPTTASTLSASAVNQPSPPPTLGGSNQANIPASNFTDSAFNNVASPAAAPRTFTPEFAAPTAAPSTAPAAAPATAPAPQFVSFEAARPQQKISPQAAVARAQAATVRIRVDEPNSVAFGTGTIINMHGNQALVLTCGHLFRDLTPDAKLSVDLYHQGRTMNLPAQVVTFNAKDADIGLMEFRSPIAIDAVPVASMAAAPQVGQPAFSFGCDKGADPSRRDTQIKRLNRYLGAANVEIQGAPIVGRSGGGLFDAEGRLIGICNAADEEDDEGIYAALPVIHQQLSALQLDSLVQQPAAVQQPAVAASSQVQAASSQVQCVIRDAQGRQSTLTIDRPSEELIAMLRQSAR